ncbi:MAG: Multi-sensor signal transduction histidine kinase [Candidatus Woesebacteria bacterium GW2011_GWB1_39_10]|uniref:histidine kinase n=2 Tax=Candidatus Woeseibacteriota TaxID=1752722 RepID=A0A0G0UXR8_9BACT|nr:MAG: Multi-sensor signal transduction histidine kinase [Candidatus Woesebacteria bacterium GW2011_GWB1_39_10]KKR92291.1 MAG: Multi-sensor signal transduction histidine kinase [Candidatus Woesebacteria bacterium GW2011_GWA1_41_13b]
MNNMNTKSINFKIILWFSSILFIATGVIFSIFFLVTSGILYQEVDRELLVHSSNPTQFNNIPGMVITILDQNGGIKQSSISYDTPFVSYKYLFESAKKSTSEKFINQNIGTTPMRFLVKPIINDGKLTEVLLIAHPIHAIQNSINLLLSTLGIIFMVLILPTILGAMFLARRIIKPISETADKMDNITSENLNERLTNPGSKDEIEKLTVTFNNLLDRIQQSFIREKHFIGDIAHELKTPLATLKGGIELTLSKDRQKTEYQKTLTESLVDINRMSALLHNILDLAWIEADKGTVNNKRFNLSETMKELREIAVKLGSQKQIKIKSNIQPDISVFGDEGKITRAILNVLDNAIKYTPRNELVYISLHKSMNHAVVEIKDSGVGIPKSDLAHIFERFYRGSKTAKTLGSGLGLAISQGIIKAHHGDITIDSLVSKGTTVKITLPI